MNMTSKEIDDTFAKFGCKSEIEEISLKSKYAEMVADARAEYDSVFRQKEIFEEIFGAENEKLVLEDSDIYFAYKEKPLTNFGVVVLDVVHVHEIERVLFDVELLVLSQHDEPKIASISSLALRSSRWIENLGVSYRYSTIESIQNAIKIMAQFAPVTKIYKYSGWAIDSPDTYIFGGIEICAKNYLF